MPEGAHPYRHQREGRRRADLHLLGELSSATARTARITHLPFFLALSAIPLASLSCDTGTTEAPPGPSVHLLEAELSTSLDAQGYPVTTTTLKPGDKAKDIVSTTSIRLRFDRFLLPTQTFRQSVCVQSDARDVKSLDDCVAGVFVEPSYDPIRRQITLRQSPDATKTHLAPATTYWVTVYPPPDDTSSGIQAFDGALLEAPQSFRFTTLDVDPAGSLVEPLPAENFCSPDKGKTPGASDHLKNCATAGCHINGAGDAANPNDAPEGLDLSDIGPLHDTAIGHVAHETQVGEHASKPENASLRFGRSMPIIAPGDPGNSYLLYKLAASPDNTTTVEESEIARLRATVVVGMPMPPSNASKAAFLDEKGLARLSDWIAAGAPTPVCK
ncbi:MAG: Ig-like domain-containing protein [Byssovorax sp.]